MKKEMLINVLQPEECRIAILEDGVLEELYVERTSHESYVGNIYKGRIVNIEPSIQAAFVDFGVGRNGFLHVSDVEPAYYRHLEGSRGGGGYRGDRGDRGDRRTGGRDQGRAPVRYEEDVPGEYEFTERPHDAPTAAEAAEEAIELQVQGELFEAIPPPPPAPPAVSDLYGEEPPVGDPVASESSTVSEPPSSETAPPLIALPETMPEEESGSRRRRSRGGNRRRRTAAERPADAESAPEAKEENPPDKPPLMESAEHRTTEKDNDPESGSAASPPSRIDADDDLLFFPQSAPRQAPPPRPEPEPQPEPQRRYEEPVFTPPARPRPPRSSGNIEDDLAADLAALDLGDEGETSKPAFAQEFEAEDSGEEGAPGPVEFGGEPSGERSFRQEEPEFAPRRYPRGEDRRPPREGGRDDRRGGPRGRGGRESRERRGSRPGTGRPKPLIQDIFKRGQEVLVQVIKEGIGTKGPTLSTYISIPGRYLVVMPHLNRVGVSRKIEDEEQRRRLR